jgi:hypothetical protein
VVISLLLKVVLSNQSIMSPDDLVVGLVALRGIETQSEIAEKYARSLKNRL